MANTYTWVISQLESYPEADGHEDVVFTVHWRRQATDGTHTADVYGSQGVTLDAGATFTPYADLTFERSASLRWTLRSTSRLKTRLTRRS
jgi:hypothetical protein